MQISKTSGIFLAVLLLSCGRVPETETQTNIGLDTTIDYQICGSGDITLMFVHGWCIDQTYWSYQTDVFCSDYQVVTLDLPGYGNSGKTRDNWTIEQYGKDVNQLIRQLQLENVVLVGHSMGGDIILEAALNNDQVTALIGIDNFKEVGMKFDKQMKEEIDGFLEVLENNFSEVAPAYAEGALFHPTTDTSVIGRVIRDIIKSDSIIAVKTLNSLFTYTEIEAKNLSKLKRKLFLINSDATPTDTAALAATGVPFKVLEIKDSGHYPMIEKPGEFNRLLLQILQEIESGT